MYSTLSKVADRSFIIGFFLPALLGSLAVLALFGHTVPLLGDMSNRISSAKSLADLTYFVVGVWSVSILLQALCYPFYRILEGYWPPLSWLPFARNLHVQRFRKLSKTKQQLTEEWETLGAAFPPEKKKELEERARALLTSYPQTESAILPSAFGNTIRAFEFYPADVYGADGITMWSRLPAVLSKTFAATIDATRANVDLLVNVVFIAGAFFVYAAVEFFAVLAAKEPWQPPAILALTAILVVLAAYWSAVSSAAVWGESVKSAFDCYLNDLLEQLGFDVAANLETRRDFWTAFSRQAIYRIPLDEHTWKYKTKR